MFLEIQNNLYLVVDICSLPSVTIKLAKSSCSCLIIQLYDYQYFYCIRSLLVLLTLNDIFWPPTIINEESMYKLLLHVLSFPQFLLNLQSQL